MGAVSWGSLRKKNIQSKKDERRDRERTELIL